MRGRVGQIQPHVLAPGGQGIGAVQAGRIHKHGARFGAGGQGLLQGGLVRGLHISKARKLRPVAQHQTPVAAQAVRVDKSDARLRRFPPPVQGQAQSRSGLTRAVRTRQHMQALGPVLPAPGPHRHHAAQAFQHRGAGRVGQALIKVHGPRRRKRPRAADIPRPHAAGE